MGEALIDFVKSQKEYWICVPEFRSFSQDLINKLKRCVNYSPLLGHDSIASGNYHIEFHYENNKLEFYYCRVCDFNSPYTISKSKLEALLDDKGNPKSLKRI